MGKTKASNFYYGLEFTDGRFFEDLPREKVERDFPSSNTSLPIPTSKFTPLNLPLLHNFQYQSPYILINPSPILKS